MSKLLSVFIVGCSIIGVTTAHAGGCGPTAIISLLGSGTAYYGGGYCERYYERWHDAYYGNHGPSYVVDTGLCWGRGTHRVCNDLGLCWRLCN